MTPPVFDLVGGQVVLGGRRVLDDVSFRVQPGEFVAVLGANGSGKTTLIRALVGLVPLSAGRLELFGTPLAHFRAWPRLGHLSRAGGSVVLVAHELGPLAALIRRAVVLSHGLVVSDGPPPQPEGHHADPTHVHDHPHEGPEAVLRAGFGL